MHEIAKDWMTKAGLRAVIVFANNSHNCGYVEVPKGHPLHGKEYSESCECLRERGKQALTEETKVNPISILTATLNADDEVGIRLSPDIVFNVHGGITFAGGGNGYPADGNGWWFGFDCAHAGDKTMTAYDTGGVFRDVDYCTQECESLADQIAQIQHEAIAEE